jgi:glucose-1-phosphate adenylyltransferase
MNPNQHQNEPHQLARRTLGLVLAGGRGSRLHALTDRRAKPAVYFGGKFRIVDFALSNCLNSGVRRVSVVTQYKSHSLLRHLQRGWSFLRSEFNEYIDLLPAQQRIDETSWYQGTADAVFQNLDILMAERPEYILVLAGDHIYKMDYANLIADHVAQGAPCTVACIEVPLAEASAFGVMAIDPQRRIVRFDEKPANPAPMPGRASHALASMGVYVFNADYLYEALKADAVAQSSSRDFGKDLIPAIVARGEAVAHPFGLSCVKSSPEAPAYWRDVGTIDAYWSANLDLTSITPPIWTCTTASGRSGPTRNSSPRPSSCSTTKAAAAWWSTRWCPAAASSRARTPAAPCCFQRCGCIPIAMSRRAVLLPEVDVGRHCRLRKVVIDKGCRIPEGMSIGFDAADDARRFFRTEQGVVLVTREMLERLAPAPRSTRCSRPADWPT